jgi:hypothetical protein
MKPVTKRIIIALCAVLTLLAATYFFRAWIRRNVIPTYADAVYSQSIDKTFDTSFASVNDSLNKVGFGPFGTIEPARCIGGDEVRYEKLRLTVTCSRTHGVRAVYDNAFVSAWKANSQSIEDKLISAGWQKLWGKEQPITQFYDNPGKESSIAMKYSKQEGKTTCELLIIYNARTTDKEATYATESCTRYIAFFGGY